MNDETEIIVCQGPPACPFEGDAAVQNQIDGCPNCRRIVVLPDGTEVERQNAPN